MTWLLLSSHQLCLSLLNLTSCMFPDLIIQMLSHFQSNFIYALKPASEIFVPWAMFKWFLSSQRRLKCWFKAGLQRCQVYFTCEDLKDADIVWCNSWISWCRFIWLLLSVSWANNWNVYFKSWLMALKSWNYLLGR